MAVAYILTSDNVLTREQMSLSEWEQERSHSATLTVEDSSGNYHDVSEWIAELKIVHNELDAEGSGRDTKTGKMKRTLIATKHTLNVMVMDKVPQGIAHYIFSLVDNDSSRTSVYVHYQCPCPNGIWRQNMYCSTVNFGAQRYDKNDGRCYYDGMNFNLIEV